MPNERNVSSLILRIDDSLTSSAFSLGGASSTFSPLWDRVESSLGFASSWGVSSTFGFFAVTSGFESRSRSRVAVMVKVFPWLGFVWHSEWWFWKKKNKNKISIGWLRRSKTEAKLGLTKRDWGNNWDGLLSDRNWMLLFLRGKMKV